MVGNQIRASYVDWMIISSQIVQNRTLRKKSSLEHGNPKNRANRSNKIDKTSENSKYESESQNIYVSMEHMSTNA